jgi:hypothetical protein
MRDSGGQTDALVESCLRLTITALACVIACAANL